MMSCSGVYLLYDLIRQCVLIKFNKYLRQGKLILCTAQRNGKRVYDIVAFEEIVHVWGVL